MTVEIEMNPRNLSLIRAVTDDDTAAVRALLAAGSDVNRPTSGGQTPLIIAVVFRRIKILSLLLEAGADPQLRDDLGLNAVDWSERKGFAEGVKLLTQSQGAKRETPPDALRKEPTIPGESVPRQIEKQSPPVSRQSKQSADSDEKTRRWIAGLKQRIDEEASHKVKEVQPAPSPPAEIESAPEEDSSHIVVNDSPSAASPTVPTPAVIESPPERLSNVTPDTSKLKEEPHAAQAMTPLVPPDDVARSQPSSSTVRTPSTSSSRKRCPKCNAVYDSELLAYCAIDMTPLVAADQPVVTLPPETARLSSVWFLVIFTFLVAAGVAYFMIPSLRNERGSPTTKLPIQAVNVQELPLVGGGLSGKQLEVPAAEYPASARSEHVSGTVTIRVTVDKKGRVSAVKVVEGDRRLREAAIAAAQRATFSPEKLMGQGAVGTIAYTFKE
jgi:TonB family protein